MGNEEKTKKIKDLLGKIRTDGVEKSQATKELLELLTGDSSWSPRQCWSFYDSLLTNYIDDQEDLALMRAVSGVSTGYKDVTSAIKRREKYVDSLDETSKYHKYQFGGLDSLRRTDEDVILGRIASRIYADSVPDSAGNIKIVHLIKQWTTAKKDEPPRLLNTAPVEELFPTAKDIILAPGDIFQLKVAVIPKEAVDAPLSYISKDTDIVTVSNTGMLLAHGEQKKKTSILGAIFGGAKQQTDYRRTTDVIIQAESGVTATKDVTVEGIDVYDDSSNFDINEFVPTFWVEQKVRLVGTSSWDTTVEAQVGDMVELQVQYKNISESDHANVMLRCILPPSLRYIPSSTTVYNSVYKEGVKIEQDYIATTKAINIGNYRPSANAYMRITAEVLGDNLKVGSNTLVSWAQCCVKRVTLQDYAAAIVHKSE